MKNKFWDNFLIFLLPVTICGIAGCSDRPSNVLPEDEMVSLLVDMELAEGYINTSHAANGKERIKIGKQVLKSHGVTEETLDTTLAWYGRNLDDYTALFDKVDKEISKQRKKYTNDPSQQVSISSDNLWPYSEHILISPLSGNNAFNFSISTSSINKGDILELSFASANSESIKGRFGVEYSDGSGEGVESTYSAKKSFKIELHSDSSKIVSRIFGTMYIKDRKSLPIYLDSLKIINLPFDSLHYLSKRRSQKSFGLKPLPKIKESQGIKTDTLSINNEQDTLSSQGNAEEKTFAISQPFKNVKTEMPDSKKKNQPTPKILPIEGRKIK